MKRIKKFLLLFSTIILLVLLLELVLRIESIILKQTRDNNNLLLENFNETIRILTLGESTTDYAFANEDSWPSQLENFLNKQNTTINFKVFNEGMTVATTDYIVNHIGSFVNKYQPNIVISMMGINDPNSQNLIPGEIIYRTSFLAKYSKTYNFFFMIITNIKFQFEKNSSNLISKELSCYNLSSSQLTNNSFVFEYINLTNKSLPSEISCEFLEEANDFLARSYLLRNNCSKANIFVENYISFHPNDNGLYKELFYCYKDKNIFFNEETFLKYQLSRNPMYDRLYDLLGKYYEENNYSRKAQKMFDKASEIRVNSRPSVKIAHESLYYILKDQNIAFIVMQYPTLPIEEMKSYFSESDDVIFISNEKNFEFALQDHDYYDLFIDHFAGTWGHCTKNGNLLIAENVANKVVSLFNKEI